MKLKIPQSFYLKVATKKLQQKLGALGHSTSQLKEAHLTQGKKGPY